MEGEQHWLLSERGGRALSHTAATLPGGGRHTQGRQTDREEGDTHRAVRQTGRRETGGCQTDREEGDTHRQTDREEGDTHRAVRQTGRRETQGCQTDRVDVRQVCRTTPSLPPPCLSDIPVCLPPTCLTDSPWRQGFLSVSNKLLRELLFTASN